MHVVCNTLHVFKACLVSAVHQVLLDCLLTLLQSLDLQTSIQTDGYRSLREAEEVEFDVESGDDGRTKAVNVTGPGGAPPLVRIPEHFVPLISVTIMAAVCAPASTVNWLWHGLLDSSYTLCRHPNTECALHQICRSRICMQVLHPNTPIHRCTRCRMTTGRW